MEYSAKANFRKLGSRLGSKMRDVALKVERLSGREIQGLLDGSTLNLEIDSETLELTGDDVIVQRNERENLKVLNEGSLTVALDPEITEELRHEGIVRDLIRQVQNHRKEGGLEVSDRITLSLEGDEELRLAVQTFEEYLMNETLAVAIRWETPDDSTAVTVGDLPCTIAVTKA